MTIRTVPELIDLFRSSLRDDNSELATFPQFGNLYAIYRSVGIVVQEQDTKLDNFSDSLFLTTATGDALDQKALEFNITRLQGSPSSGSIIVLGNNTTIPADLIVSDINTGLQFRLINKVNIIGNRSKGSIVSLENTPNANILAGTKLTSSLYPSHQFIVGTKFNVSTNSYEGNLIGGTYREEDDELRDRVISTLQNLSLSTNDAIRNAAINTTGVSRVSVKENTPSLGFITVYINNADRTIIKQVENKLEAVKPVGTALRVTSFKEIAVDVTLVITTFNKNRIQALSNQIAQSIQTYISNISTNSTLTKEGIAGTVLQNTAVSNVEVVTPTGAVAIADNEILNLGNVNITYR